MKIRLYLLKDDRTSTELTIHSIAKIYELDFFGLLLSSETEIEAKNDRLLIGDYGCDLKYIASIDNYFWYKVDLEGINDKNTIYSYNQTQIEFRIKEVNIGKQRLFRIFSLYAGQCVLKFINTDINDNKEEQVLAIIEIKPSKLTEDELNLIFTDLVEKQVSFFSKKLSLTRFSSDNENSKLDISHLEFLDKMQGFLNEIYVYRNSFRYDKFSTIENKELVEEWSDSKPISQDFDRWIGQNTNFSYSTTLRDKSGILINNKSFKFTHGLYDTNEITTDVIENHLIHGVIHRFFSKLHKIEIDLNRLNSDQRDDFKSKFIAIYHEYCQKKISQCRTVINELQYLFDTYIPVNKEKPSNFINFERILTKNHYAKTWDIGFNKLNIESNNYGNFRKLFRINDLATLYEQFCFLELVYAVSENFKTEMIISEDFKQAKSKDNNIIIYYQNAELFITTKKGQGNLNPDFIIEIKFGGSAYLIILDAKYKKHKSVEKYDIPDTVLKYLHGMTPKDKSAKILGLFLIFPKTDNREEILDYYLKDIYRVDKPIFPLIGWVSAFPQKTNMLKELIGNLKRNVLDILENSVKVGH